MKPRPMSQPIRTKQSNRFPILESKFWDASVPKSTEVFSRIGKKGSLKWCPLRLVAHFWVTNIGSSLDWLLIFEKPILAFPQIWEAVKHFGLRAQVYFLMILFVFLRKKLYFFRKLKEPPAARTKCSVSFTGAEPFTLVFYSVLSKSGETPKQGLILRSGGIAP